MQLLHIPMDSMPADLDVLSSEKIIYHPVSRSAVVSVIDLADLPHETLLPGIV